jgi:hypothetical protein
VKYFDRVTCLKRQNAGSTAAELNEFNKNLNKNFQELDYDNNGLVELVDFENRIQRQDYDSKCSYTRAYKCFINNFFDIFIYAGKKPVG